MKEVLRELMEDSKKSSSEDIIQEAQRLTFTPDGTDLTPLLTFARSVQALDERLTYSSDLSIYDKSTKRKLLFMTVVKKLGTFNGKPSIHQALRNYLLPMNMNGKEDDVKWASYTAFFIDLLAAWEKIVEHIGSAKKIGAVIDYSSRRTTEHSTTEHRKTGSGTSDVKSGFSGSGHPKSGKSGTKSGFTGSDPNKRASSELKTVLDYDQTCTGCGRKGHLTAVCHGRKNKVAGFNYNDNISWKSSPDAGRMFPDKDTLPLGRAAYAPESQAKRPRQGKSLYTISEENTNNDECELTLFTARNKSLTTTNCLFDTGALQANYISKEMFEQLKKLDARVRDCSGQQVCSCFGECRKCLGIVFCFVKLLSKDNSEYKTFPIELKAVDITKYDIIIGRKTLIEQNILVNMTTSNKKSKKDSNITKLSIGIDIPFTERGSREIEFWPNSNTCELPISHVLNAISSPNPNLEVIRVSKHSLLGWDIDTTEDGDDPLVNVAWWDPVDDDDTLVDIVLEGPETLQKGLRDLLIRFKGILTDLTDEPASVKPPMELVVDESKWKKKSNRTPPRPQTIPKQDEIRRQIEMMLEKKIIQPSMATEYSQALLTPKKPVHQQPVYEKLSADYRAMQSNRDIQPPKPEWRFCIDYRNLNDASEGASWPIPNIRSIFQRLGSKRAKYYGTIDLKSGYHQMPLAMNSRVFTAFITFMGVFEFLRVPFGLKGAPSFFQRLMETTVLAGLLWTICEVYIDDIIVFGNTETEFLHNMNSILLRCEKHNIKVNPKKMKLGLSKIEYVGHTIDQNGMAFSKEKTHTAFMTPRPETEQEVKSFLGLANWFRDHIKDHSTLVHPIQQLIVDYHKHKKVIWNRVAEEAFETIKSAINNCPTLHFIRPVGEIFLQTDASDYGIGGYLFQRIDGIDYPIAFVSKALTAAQILKWAANEKEAFAIFFSMMKLDYLIRDTHFILQTDHRNLTFISEGGSPRVRRWKIAVQEFDFDLEYIKGEHNFIADKLSRDIVREGDTLAAMSSVEYDTSIPNDKYKMISSVHNSNVGHHGVDRTMTKLTQQGRSWDHMRQHVRSFVRNCPCCQKMRDISPSIVTTPYTLARYEPMERLNIDTIGPLPADSKGNRHILVIIDCFTRFIELYPLKDTTAIGAAQSLLHHVGRYGAPCELLSDNGSQFVNGVISELLKLVGTQQILTLAYSHEENGVVERANKSIMDYLRAILFDKNVITEWADSLPIVQRIHNATRNESMGFSPSQLIFGNAITLDRGMFLPHNTPKSTVSKEPSDTEEFPYDTQHREVIQLSEWSEKMLEKQNILIGLAQANQHLTDMEHTQPLAVQRRKRTVTPIDKTKLPITEFLIGSYVLVAYRESPNHRPPHKLLTRWRGPLRVVNHVGSTYSLQNLVNNKLEDIHVTQLKPFRHDTLVTDPRLIANKDFQAWDIEAILDHRGDIKKRDTLEFLVHWAGYPAADANWQPWKNVRLTGKLLTYLQEHRGLKSLINKRIIQNPKIT
jgi:transposase InsO family protein